MPSDRVIEMLFYHIRALLPTQLLILWGSTQGASGNRKTSTYGTYLPRFERKKICQIAAGRNF